MQKRKNETEDQFRARRKEYDAARRAANPEANRAMATAWAKANPERKKANDAVWRESNIDRMRAARASWKSRNKDRLRVHKQTRRARITGSGGVLSADIAERLMRLQKGKCTNCRLKLGAFHLDHIFPLALGGENKDENIQLLCPACNCRKNAKHPVDFAQEEGWLL